MGIEIMKLDIKKINAELNDKSPAEIIRWAIALSNKYVVTTNFRPYECAILHACTRVDNNMKVIWCDTGYNTLNTYKHADELINTLKLNVDIYVPKLTSGYIDATIGIPDIDHENHKQFSDIVKMEPFARAMSEHKPEVWFTNLRKGQTAFRDSIGIVSVSKDGIIKVSPFYNYSDKEMDEYVKENNLPNEFKYFDPTKVLENRECGLHG
jgi:phosphoadenosine phosphosulfate reductase